MVSLKLRSVMQGSDNTAIRFTVYPTQEVEGETVYGDPTEFCTVVVNQAMTLEEVNTWLEEKKLEYT